MTLAIHQHQHHHRHHTTNVDERQRSRTAEGEGGQVTRLTPISASERRQRPLCGPVAGRRGREGALRASTAHDTPAPQLHERTSETNTFSEQLPTGRSTAP